MSQPAAIRRGLYVDLITPCAADGHLLPREYHVHLRRMARVRDIQGVIVNGPAGEAAVLDRAQRMKILQLALSAAPSGFPVFAAVPAAISELEDELAAVAETAASGIVLLTSGGDIDDKKALDWAVEAQPERSVVSWGMALPVVANTPGLAAAVVDEPASAPLPGIEPGKLPVFLTDRSLDLKAISNGAAAGAVLSAANIAESHWGKVFRHAVTALTDAETLYASRLSQVHETLLAISAGPGERRVNASAIKYALVLMTQNTSAATLPPVLNLNDHHQQAVSQALRSGKLMPGMG